MAMRAIHEYLADALIKEIGVFGKSIAAERIAKSLQLWETTYGSAIADKARKLIAAEWRKRFKTRGAGLGPSHRGGGADGQDQGPA